MGEGLYEASCGSERAPLHAPMNPSGEGVSPPEPAGWLQAGGGQPALATARACLCLLLTARITTASSHPHNLHRIGRTGRAGRKGVAVTFLTLGDTGAPAIHLLWLPSLPLPLLLPPLLHARQSGTPGQLSPR